MDCCLLVLSKNWSEQFFSMLWMFESARRWLFSGRANPVRGPTNPSAYTDLFRPALPRLDAFKYRGPITIFGSIFKVDHAENPDLGIAERGWRSLVENEGVSKEEEGKEGPRSSGREGRKREFLVLAASEIANAEVIPSSASKYRRNPHLRRTPPLPSSKKSPPPASFQPSIHSSGPKIVDGKDSAIFGAENRRLKMGGFSIFCSEDRRWKIMES